MGTVLTFRNDGERPFCEIALDDGERIQMQLDKNGLVIERQAVGTKPAEVLFKGDADLVTDMCMAFTGDKPTSRKSALEILTAVVTQIPSGPKVRDAFKAAARAV